LHSLAGRHCFSAGRQCPLRVKLRKPQIEQMFSALPPTADIPGGRAVRRNGSATFHIHHHPNSAHGRDEFFIALLRILISHNLISSLLQGPTMPRRKPIRTIAQLNVASAKKSRKRDNALVRLRKSHFVAAVVARYIRLFMHKMRKSSAKVGRVLFQSMPQYETVADRGIPLK
jgi:hypothetical protein